MNILHKFGGEANQNITTAKVGGFLRIIKLSHLGIRSAVQQDKANLQACGNKILALLAGFISLSWANCFSEQ
jgi:hypothetical protein